MLLENERNDQKRVVNGKPYWCRCSGLCGIHPTIRECYCCTEISESDSEYAVKLHQNIQDGCITESRDFQLLCLDPLVRDKHS